MRLASGDEDDDNVRSVRAWSSSVVFNTQTHNTQTQVLLDFYQVHTYANDLNSRFSTTSPMTMSRDEYQISDKPYVIGEFSTTKCESTGCTIESLYKHALS